MNFDVIHTVLTHTRMRDSNLDRNVLRAAVPLEGQLAR